MDWEESSTCSWIIGRGWAWQGKKGNKFRKEEVRKLKEFISMDSDLKVWILTLKLGFC